MTAKVIVTTYGRKTDAWSSKAKDVTALPDYLIANYTKPNAGGLAVHECACGSHIWALPWDVAMDRWVRHARSPLRTMFEEMGLAPEVPKPSPHVIIASHDDAHLLKLRRWRVLPAKKGHRVKWHLKSGTRGMALQRMIFPTAEAITFENSNGLDCRRENLRRTTIRQLLRERDARLRGKTAAEVAATQIAT